ncbi:MAG: cyclic nucleotide-binding domain-containing protein [Chloroflexi bacterium]|nr:cyclic nucleotide-binding domain-containing protein [Chloroflexota bacterium]
MTQSNSSPSYASLVKHIASTDLFKEFDAEILQSIVSDVHWMTLAEGETLFRQGDAADALYIVASGCLQVVIAEADSLERILGEIKPGETIGATQILTGKARSTSIHAIANSELVGIPKPVFDRLIHENPQVATKMNEVMARRLQQNQLLAVLPNLFGPLDIKTLREVETKLEWVYLPSSQLLMKRGDLGNNFYIVVSGRLVAKVIDSEGNETIAGEVVPGETIGEMQLLSGESTVANVYAARDSKLIKFSKENFDWLLLAHPQVMRKITTTIVHHLRRVLQGLPATKPHSNLALDLVVVPAGPDVPLTDFVQRFATKLQTFGSVLILDSEQFDNALDMPGAAQTTHDDPKNIRGLAWLNEQENNYRFITYKTDKIMSAWTRRCLRQADQILIVGMSGSSPELGEIEAALFADEKLASIRKSLILLYENSGQQPLGTKHWLDVRDVDAYCHIRMYDDTDFERLGRLLTGNALGLVLGGGGARGFAHIGVIRALEEAGIVIDMVGGTSMGSIISGQCAMGWDYKEMIRRSKEALPSPVLDYTLPMASMIVGRNWTQMLTTLYQDRQIEDLWLNFFCVSTNLTRAEAVIHERGPLWRAIRASTAIPGVIPPIIEGDGDLLVDGGVVNNVPIDIMHNRNGGGPLIASDVSAKVDLKITSQFGPSLSGWNVFWRKISPFHQSLDVPSLATTIMRSSVIGSVHAIKAAKAMVDLYLYPPADEYGTLEFEPLEAIVEVGYRYAREKIEKWANKNR